MWFSKFWFSSFLQLKGSSDSPTRMRMKLKQICSTWVFIFFFPKMEINSHANDQVSCSYQIWKDQNVYLSCRRRERRIIDHITFNCVCHRTQRVNFSIQAIFIIVYSIACRFLVSLEYILKKLPLTSIGQKNS